MSEQWAAVPGYPGYEASDQGRVRSLERQVRCGRGGNSNRTVPPRILRPGRMGSGHLSVALGKGNSVTVHAAAMAAFVGPTPSGQEIRHRDGNPANNRLSNLHFGTRSENNHDISKHGRRKLTMAQVEECKTRHFVLGETQTALAGEFGVSISHMSAIVKGKSYVLPVR